jgi:hypothetical protein
MTWPGALGWRGFVCLDGSTVFVPEPKKIVDDSEIIHVGVNERMR